MTRQAEIVRIGDANSATHMRNPFQKRVTMCGRVCARGGYSLAFVRDALEPTCALCRRRAGLRQVSMTEIGVVEDIDEPDFVLCDIECYACDHVATWTLPADKPTREVFAGITCPRCGKRGHVGFASRPANDEGAA